MRGLLLALSCFFIAQIQAQVVWRGLVTNEKNEALPFTGININKGELGCVSDEKGYFELKLKKNQRYLVQVQRLGYYTLNKSFSTDNSDTIALHLVLQSRNLETVTIRERSDRGTMKFLDPKTTQIPTASGDFLQAILRNQPGVSMRNELSSSYSVRGGSYDENLIYVNDIEVYRPFLVRSGQQEGLSFINGDMVERVSFSAGGFEARYGDKLSSVLDVKYRKPTKFAGSAHAGLMSTSLHLEDVSKSGKTTWIGGLRYRNNGYLLKSLDTQGEYKPQYADLQTYITHRFNQNWELGFLGMYSSNRFQFVPQTRQTNLGSIQQALRFTVFFDGQEITRYRTGLGAIELNRRISDDWRVKLIASEFSTEEREEFDIIGQYSLDEVERDFSSDNFGNVTRNLGVGGYLNHARNQLQGRVSNLSLKSYQSYLNHYFQYGFSIQKEVFTDRLREYTYLDSADYSVPLNSGPILNVTDVSFANNALTAIRTQAYIQDQISYLNAKSDEWTLNLGARAQYWDVNKKWVFSPRGNIRFKPKWTRIINDSTFVNKDLVIRLAGGLYYQNPFYREMRGFDGQLNRSILAQRSIHLVLGSDYGLRMWNRPFTLTSEFFYKWYDQLIPYEMENVRLRYYATNNAKGYARGADFKLNGEFVEGVESWASLSFLSTKEDLLNDSYTIRRNKNGEEISSSTFDKVATDSTIVLPGYVPRPTDQLVSFGLFFQDQMPRFKYYKVNLNIVFASGLPYGPPSADRYRDTLRTPSYKRVDIGFIRELITPEKPGKGWAKHFSSAFISVEIFNMLQISNTINYQWIESVSGNLYSVPNYLTARRINVKLALRF